MGRSIVFAIAVPDFIAPLVDQCQMDGYTGTGLQHHCIDEIAAWQEHRGQQYVILISTETGQRNTILQQTFILATPHRSNRQIADIIFISYAYVVQPGFRSVQQAFVPAVLHRISVRIQNAYIGWPIIGRFLHHQCLRTRLQINRFEALGACCTRQPFFGNAILQRTLIRSTPRRA